VFHPDAPPDLFREAVIEGYRPYLSVMDDAAPDILFRRFDGFRVLCGLRRGPFGAAAVNRIAEAILAEAGLIRPTETWYAGRPVMITRNDYGRGLFNGDVGIALRDPGAKGEIRVFFPTADGAVRRLHPLRLPDHETVYAMTVHKSQGSEFDRVLLLLPDRDAPVLTRELLYTGLTRARESVFVWSDPSVFRQAAGRRTVRSSGLRDALWGGGA
jgi:exodeoxyribonuclease V alpha subunit